MRAAARLCEAVARASHGALQPEAAREICALMDTITAASLGLPAEPAHADGAITTHACANSDRYEVVVFAFPAGATIPLHDHPGMRVLSKARRRAAVLHTVRPPPAAPAQRAITPIRAGALRHAGCAELRPCRAG